jgi:predicted esterase
MAGFLHSLQGGPPHGSQYRIIITHGKRDIIQYGIPDGIIIETEN